MLREGFSRLFRKEIIVVLGKLGGSKGGDILEEGKNREV